MAAALEPRLLEAQSGSMAPIDFLSTLVSDELGEMYLSQVFCSSVEETIVAGGAP